MVGKILSAAFLFGIGYGITFVAGWWFPWTSIVVGVLLLFGTVVAIFDGNTRSALGFGGVLGFAVFGVLLFQSGRAELRSNAANVAELQRIDQQITTAERTLAEGKIDDAIRLCADLEPKVRDSRKTRLEEIKARAENEAKLRSARIKEANERVSQLVSAVHKKVSNFHDVSEEAEQLLSEAMSIPLATNLTGARILADDFVGRRMAAAKTLLDEGRLDEAKTQIQAARTIKGATKLEDAKPLATAIANRIIERTASDVRELIKSGDFTTAEAKIRAVLNEPDATERELASTLLETISKERVKVAANKKLAAIVAEARLEFTAGRLSAAEKLLSRGNGLPDATELDEFETLQRQIKATYFAKEYLREQKREKAEKAEAERSIAQEDQRLKRAENDANEVRRHTAWIMAEKFVKDELVSPSTANFGGVLSGDFQDIKDHVTSLGNNEFLVKGWVDSQNRFGATLRSNFSVKLKDNGKSWSLIGEPVIRSR